MYIIFY
jgi:hypothetical protein